MHCIVGLGNPGGQYERTRHNAGFMVVDELAAKYKTRLLAGKGDFWFASCTVAGVEAVLLKPSTYMNNSGIAVVQAMERFGVQPAELLVVFDDFHLPLGRLRLRPSGSDGGHHGLESVIYHVQSDNIPRLRFGIAPETAPVSQREKVDFVLEEFTQAEMPVVNEQVGNAGQAAELFIRQGISAAMNRFNSRPSAT